MTSTSHPPSVASLLEHTEWVRRLAHTLVREGTGDDVAQDAWAAALRKPPRTGRNVRGWFATLVRNSARQRARSETRLRRRERAVERDVALPSTAELVERADLHRHVVQTVMTMAEPGRTIVLLHFFEGMPLREIARLQAVPLETVRTRLRRTLVRLRTSLSARHGGAWMVLAVPAFEAPAMFSGTMISGTAAVVATAQGVAMSLKVKLAAALVLVCLAGLGLHAATDSSASAPAVAVAGSAIIVASSSALDASGSTEGLAPTRDLVAEPASATQLAAQAEPKREPVVLYGKLIGLRSSVPWTATLAIGAGGEDRPEVHVQVKANGRFTAEVSRYIYGPTGIEVVADDPCYLRVRRTLSPRMVRAASAQQPLEIEVSCACMLSGRVLTAEQKAVDGAHVSVHVFNGDVPAGQPIDVTRCDSDGNYRARIPGGAVCLVVALPPDHLLVPLLGNLPHIGALFQKAGLQGWLPASTRVRGINGTEHTADDIVMRPGQPVKGKVRWADGAPVKNARVRAQLDDNEVMLYPPETDVRWWPDDTLWFDELHTQTDSGGDFVLDNLPARACRVRVDYWIDDTIVHAPGLERTLRAPAYDVDFFLPAAVLEVSVQHDGELIPGAHIGVEREGLLLKQAVDRGRTLVVMEPDANYRISASAKGYLERSIDITALAGPTSRIIALDRAPDRSVTLQLRGVADVEVAHFVWTRLDEQGVDAIKDERQSNDGVFRFDDLPPGHYRVDVRRPRMPGQRLKCAFADTSLEVHVPYSGAVTKHVSLARGGRLRIRATTPNGVFLGGTAKLIAPNGEPVAVRFQVGGSGGYVTGGEQQVLARGVNECDRLLLPGLYQVHLQLDGCAPRIESVLVEPAGIAVVEVIATPQ